jgi:hypothetical protein
MSEKEQKFTTQTQSCAIAEVIEVTFLVSCPVYIISAPSTIWVSKGCQLASSVTWRSCKNCKFPYCSSCFHTYAGKTCVDENGLIMMLMTMCFGRDMDSNGFQLLPIQLFAENPELFRVWMNPSYLYCTPTLPPRCTSGFSCDIYYTWRDQCIDEVTKHALFI